LSAALFVLFFILTGYNYGGPRTGAIFFGFRAGFLSVENSSVYFMATVLGASIGLIASVVRYRHPIRSTFGVVTIAQFLGIVLYFTSFAISPAFADAEAMAHAVEVAVFWMFVYFFIFSIGFSSCAVCGCVGGHIIQERSKRWVATPALPSLVTLAIGIMGCAAALASTFWPKL